MLQPKLDIHEICELFPPMLDDQFIQLKRDIRDNGLVEPGVVYEGKILDGRHRYQACVELGIEFRYEILDDDHFDPVKYVLSKNLHRRHLSKSQWAMVGADLRKYFDKQAKERQVTSGKDYGRGKVVEKLPQPIEQLKARDEVGKVVGVSGKMIDLARQVKSDGCKELQRMVRDGEVSVAKAAEITKRSEVAWEQIQMAKQSQDNRYVRDEACPRTFKTNHPVFTDEDMAMANYEPEAKSAVVADFRDGEYEDDDDFKIEESSDWNAGYCFKISDEVDIELLDRFNISAKQMGTIPLILEQLDHPSWKQIIRWCKELCKYYEKPQDGIY